ncbi:hypothetical protein AB833_00840 [Chromatiales bacterium (ex Bugula neritina AB1)]|nr:hypothetical protein AB833_00840 [Chromatiales bacterium (ex Bugula neritina AB1)]
MKNNHLKHVGIGILLAGVAGCAVVGGGGEADPRWADYKNWHKLTADKVGTGDPVGILGNVHKGKDGYRDVYVNDIGKATITGSAPYVFPAGSIVIKEQFANKADWEAGKNPGMTISIKKQDGSGSSDNWEWANKYTGKAGPSAFCAGCHTAAIGSDFVFTTADFLAEH